MLSKWLAAAISERASQSAALAEFSESQKEYVSEWECQIAEWEAGQSKDNPYYLPHSGVSEQEVHLQLTEEEEARARAGIPSLHDVSPVKFVMVGLELEEMQ